MLRSKLIRLAHANPGSLREALLPILKEGASGEKQEIILRSWEVLRVEDSYEHGEIGRLETVQYEKQMYTFADVRQLQRYLYQVADAPSDKKAWYIFGGEEGRVEASWSGDENGYLPGQKDLEAFKRGEKRLWTFTLTAMVQVGRVWTPGAKELSRILGLPIQ